jgi:hypothetical protein
MKKSAPQFKIIFLSLTLFLTACSGQLFQKPTPTPTLTSTPTLTFTPSLTPTPTETATPSPTSTPTITDTPTATLTPTMTFTPSITEPPQPASLAGKIFLSSSSTQPFVSVVELREIDTFNLIGKANTDSAGAFAINNIQPGTYDLWVLITTQSEMISGCNDVTPPDMTWLMGLKFTENQALTMENAYLSKALMFNDALKSSGMQATGFYTVLSGLQISSGEKKVLDVKLVCK